MAVDKLVDSAQLDAGLTAVANAIRTSGGTAAQLSFPSGFVSAISTIQTQCAYIVITAPAGSLLTCGIQTYQLGAQETQHSFEVRVLGSYVCTATLGSKSASKTIIVESLGAYEVELNYKMMIYSYGTEYTEGGLIGNSDFYYDNRSSGSIAKNSRNIDVYVADAVASYILTTSQKIDITNYSTLYIRADYIYDYSFFGETKLNSGNLRSFTLMRNGAGIYSRDISSISGEAYIFVGVRDKYSGVSRRCVFSQIWLEL